MKDDFYDFDPFKLFKKFEKMFSDMETADRKIKSTIREPLVDVSETETEIKILVELPGVDKKDIDLEVKGNFLIIKAGISRQNKKEQKDYLCQERTYQQYYRMVPLTKDVDSKKIDAKYNNGILEIILTKKTESKKVVNKIKVK
ncbi:MAG: molecular chaperone [Candidatus Diapherotrites archaeon CG09_land_8_20_14_0_10_32_12]|nr:MAG: molecular chaperone [Candidatus Diapherotrites archaeon CG09_land_8_20_14_0_10_32_12]